MELNQLIQQLLESGIIENQELGVELLKSPDVSEEEKKKYLDGFIKEYTSGRGDFFSEDHKNLFRSWVELYSLITNNNKDAAN